MSPTLTQMTISPVVRDTLESNRNRGHVHIMTGFARGLGRSPRAAAGVLWHLDTRRNELLVQSTEPAQRPDILGAVIRSRSIDSPTLGQAVTVKVSIACLKTPPSDVPVELRGELQKGKCYRSRTVVVPEAERAAWALRRLTAIGLDVVAESLMLSRLHHASLGGSQRGIPYVDLSVEARVQDPVALHGAMVNGVGKGRSYGLALLRVTTAPTTPQMPTPSTDPKTEGEAR
ncbi:CRISPR system Cascade subunit CasE [Sanguibacter gelidistatuariae]|uniref:CRISPR system Cascade subunit CasE n=1 Tax=Sanguibacter gelidistatuariae TaxID=1814289 RepID=A0A1G6JQE0_9MICO|nr:type I-E CRISPR-associated protein Cas6/Cse3/CasE [Sanguibacter gelidistatuariae]SDC20960.1 CRISPR system Cascade subunit CasE [Sanguibacter gelidistatuariae]